jgi:hypothetical protein
MNRVIFKDYYLTRIIYILSDVVTTEMSNQLQGAMQNMLKMTRFVFIQIKFHVHLFKMMY